MRIVEAGIGYFTEAVVTDIERFMNDGFSREIPRRVFCPYRFKNFVFDLLTLTPSVAYLVFDDDNEGRCEGVFVGVIAPDVVTSDMLGTQLVWRVSDKARGNGMPLLEIFTEWCRKHGATKIIVAGGHGKASQNRLAIKLRLRGFEPVTEHWMRGV